jgi:hypothetical protein
MAQLDVNDVMLDPDLSTVFDVRRQQETINEANGRTVLRNELFEGVIGIVTWDDGTITQTENAVIAAQTINVATPFSLRDASFGYQPDIIIWQGAEYRVTMTKPHRHLGRGWTRAKAESTRGTDSPAPTGSTS